MKKWKEHTRQEKIMIIVILVLLIAVLVSWGRVSSGFDKGLSVFYGTPPASLNPE